MMMFVMLWCMNILFGGRLMIWFVGMCEFE